MRRLLVALAITGGTMAPAALAQTPVCDAYSKTCVGGVKQEQKPPAVRPSRGGVGLPITGGELVGMMVLGGGAVAGGSILVVAGRKRRLAS